MRIAPFGAWPSSVTADRIASSQVGLGAVALDGADVYWIEARPAEAGRCVVVRRDAAGAIADVTPAPFSARARVHEYGGGAFAVREGVVCFTNFADQQVYLQRHGAAPQAISSVPASRFADFAFDAARARVICVCEEHGTDKEPRNSLVAIRLDGGGVSTLAAGHDFYATPRLSADGTQLAWLTWDHPRMPWDGSQLWVAPIDAGGGLSDARCIAGGETESIFQPAWSPDGSLVFASDRSGFWNLYRWSDGGEIVALSPRRADFGMAQWVFGQSTHAFDSEARLVCACIDRGTWHLGTLDPRRPESWTPIELPFTDVGSLQAGGGRAVFVAAGPTDSAAIVELDLESGVRRILKRSNELDLDVESLSRGEALEFPTADGESAHAFFYAPKNRDYIAPEGEKPPLLVMSHGGPTSSTSSSLSLRIQYWTSRGIAVLDVNYRGSTGYGRAHREALKGKWGVADVDDCVHGALALVAAGKADGDRLAITGGSAGGYTTLCALTFRDVFHAGASYYGIGDLEALAHDTHKFESRYEDGLVGPYPERADLYRARSPIHFVEQLSCPVIFFQGMDDRVVPPSQAEAMVAALRAKGLAVEYLAFEGEGHGFRRAETIKTALEAELHFYARVFGFAPAGDGDGGR